MIAQSEMLPLPEKVPAPEGDTPTWFTNLKWFQVLEARLLAKGLIPRAFDLDPCGSSEAPVSVLISKRYDQQGAYWSETTDGLAQSWEGRVAFVNPPYDAESLEKWCPKMQAEYGLADGIVALLPAWTDRGWWQDTIEPARRAGTVDVQFIRGRLRFGWPGNPDGVGGDGAKFPSAVVVWRPR